MDNTPLFKPQTHKQTLDKATGCGERIRDFQALHCDDPSFPAIVWGVKTMAIRAVPGHYVDSGHLMGISDCLRQPGIMIDVLI